jgi:2-polyprenyl-3-methyl-5-hydroxy-6-metoxy-1,4-benzoquinol methylase
MKKFSELKKENNFKDIYSINEIMVCCTEDLKFSTFNKSQIIKLLEQNDEDLLTIWKNSDRTDFSIYQDYKYNLAGVYCYYTQTLRCLGEVLKFIYINSLQNLSIYDDYNGIGLSSIYLMLQKFNVSYMNDNKNQIDIFNRLCNLHDLQTPFNDLKRKNKYDIVLSFEVAEHYKDPSSYINELIDMINPNGYLIISHSLHYPNAPGHFEEYEINNILYNNKHISKEFNNILKRKMIKVYSGWNGRPQFFKKYKGLYE